jgi:hypothetical protein
MVEVLAIFGFLAWLFEVSYEWLSAQPAFPAIALAAILIPIFVAWEYRYLSRAWNLHGMFAKREPIPPERFYWPAQERKLRFLVMWLSAVAVSAWWNAATLPASGQLNFVSVAGWMNALVGTLAAARVISLVALFFQASQWFDAMTPNLVGLLRRAMYKLSDNYEYLGQKRRDREKEEVY